MMRRGTWTRCAGSTTEGLSFSALRTRPVLRSASTACALRIRQGSRASVRLKSLRAASSPLFRPIRIVAQLQRFLRGDTGTSSVSGAQAAPQGASRVSTSAVREALAASAAGRTAGDFTAFAESLPPELSDEKVDFVPDGMKEYDVSGMPPTCRSTMKLPTAMTTPEIPTRISTWVCDGGGGRAPARLAFP